MNSAFPTDSETAKDNYSNNSCMSEHDHERTGLLPFNVLSAVSSVSELDLCQNEPTDKSIDIKSECDPIYLTSGSINTIGIDNDTNFIDLTEELEVPKDLLSNATVSHIDSKEENINQETEDFTDSTHIVEKNFLIDYDFKHIPVQVTGSWKEFSSGSRNNFTRGCKWAPDGSCLLSCSDDNILRIFNLPHQIWNASDWCDIDEMEAVVKMSEGELIYDFCWYPLMNSAEPATCCLVSASKSSTVHLWDGFTGELRCSYRTYSHMDEIVTPHSLGFDCDGQRLFCGFEKIVRVFDVDKPGRNCEQRPLFSKKSGQPGIVSCFSFTPMNRNISALGTYQKTIGIYSEPSGNLECILEGQKGGVTQLQFSPDGMLLYSGGRKDPEILCWDLRNLGSVLYCLRRSCTTNQRMYFDVSRCGTYVVSGNQNGVISIWDVTKPAKTINLEDFDVIEPIQFYMAHEDCVNGISLHPSLPLLCSSSGQRKFPDLLEDEEEAIFSPKIQKRDNSLRLWWIGKS